MKIKTLPLGKIKPYERNPRRNDAAVDAVAESMRQCGYVAPIIVDEDGVILAGHTRYKALKTLGWATAKVCVAEGLSEEQKRKYRILDNKTNELAEWDEDLLAIELDGLDFDGFDFGLLDMVAPVEKDNAAAPAADDGNDEEAEEAAREAAEAEGLDEDDPEYQAFVDKFKPKKTTDDCYTPEPVYEAVAEWVAKEYGVERSRFVRPFYPGGNYQAFAYAPDAVVVDNPPFSILSEILTWYAEQKVKFFLFAPTLTLFSSSSQFACALPCGVAVTYENGANVSTSFLTNLEPAGTRVRLIPELYQAVKSGNDENLGYSKKELPRYEYPHEVLTAAAARLCKNGQALTFMANETEHIRALDVQKDSGAAIFGSGYLLASRASKKRAEAEVSATEYAATRRAAADQAQQDTPTQYDVHWKLSERERAIIARMDEAVAQNGV